MSRIAADRGGYLSGLTLFRLGDAAPWVDWFAGTVAEAADASVNLVHAVMDLQSRWETRLVGVREGATARRLLPVLAQHPVLSASTVATSLGVSERAGRDALRTLVTHGIVVPFTPMTRSTGRPRRWWVAAELLDLVTAWSRPG